MTRSGRKVVRIQRNLDGTFALPLTKKLAREFGPHSDFELFAEDGKISYALKQKPKAHLDVIRERAKAQNPQPRKPKPDTKPKPKPNESERYVLNGHLPELVEMVEAGHTLQEMANRFGCTRESVRQMLDRNGLKSKHREIDRERRERFYAQHKQEMIDAIVEHGSVKRAAEQTDFSKELLIKVYYQELDDEQRKQAEIKKRFSYAEGQALLGTKNSNDEMLDWLRQAAAEIDYKPLGHTEYDKMARRHGWLGSQSFNLRFGTFRQACEIAGVTAADSVRGGYESFSAEQCLTAVRQVAIAMGKIPTYSEYEQHAVGSRPRTSLVTKTGLPSGSTVRKRCGSWKRVMEKLIEEGIT